MNTTIQALCLAAAMLFPLAAVAQQKAAKPVDRASTAVQLAVDLSMQAYNRDRDRAMLELESKCWAFWSREESAQSAAFNCGLVAMANRYIFAAQRIAEGHETAPEFTGDQVQERYVIFAVGRGLTQRQIELTMVQLDRHKALMVRLIRRTGLSVEG